MLSELHTQTMAYFIIKSQKPSQRGADIDSRLLAFMLRSLTCGRNMVHLWVTLSALEGRGRSSSLPQRRVKENIPVSAENTTFPPPQSAECKSDCRESVSDRRKSYYNITERCRNIKGIHSSWSFISGTKDRLQPTSKLLLQNVTPTTRWQRMQFLRHPLGASC